MKVRRRKLGLVTRARWDHSCEGGGTTTSNLGPLSCGKRHIDKVCPRSLNQSFRLYQSGKGGGSLFLQLPNRRGGSSDFVPLLVSTLPARQVWRVSAPSTTRCSWWVLKPRTRFIFVFIRQLSNLESGSSDTKTRISNLKPRDPNLEARTSYHEPCTSDPRSPNLEPQPLNLNPRTLHRGHRMSNLRTRLSAVFVSSFLACLRLFPAFLLCSAVLLSCVFFCKTRLSQL